MFNRTREVMKNKGKIEKALKMRQKQDMINLRNKSSFKAKLYDELKHIEIILQDPDISSVEVVIQDKYMALFSSAIYDEDLAGYDVSQIDGESNKFSIKRKFITF